MGRPLGAKDLHPRRRSPNRHPIKVRPQAERFWEKVSKTAANGCWDWLGGHHSYGYGTFWREGRPVGAHRVAYELTYGSIPTEMVIDHLCRVPGCVNPDHMEVVSQQENTLRGYGPASLNARKTNCRTGHLFDSVNTYVYQGRRQCRACRRQAVAKHTARLRGE